LYEKVNKLSYDKAEIPLDRFVVGFVQLSVSCGLIRLLCNKLKKWSLSYSS